MGTIHDLRRAPSVRVRRDHLHALVTAVEEVIDDLDQDERIALAAIRHTLGNERVLAEAKAVHDGLGGDTA